MGCRLRPSAPVLVHSRFGTAVRLGAAMADVAIPAEEVRGLLLEQLLRQPLGPQAQQHPHQVPILRHTVPEQPGDLLPNLGARCYPGHGSRLPFCSLKELVSADTIRVAQAVNFYRDSNTSPDVVGLIGFSHRQTPCCQNQKTPGINRQRTFAQYSVYPGKFLERNRSSSRSRPIRNGIMPASTSSPQYEPSANGVPRR